MPDLFVEFDRFLKSLLGPNKAQAEREAQEALEAAFTAIKPKWEKPRFRVFEGRKAS
jgi:hypothetical protein